jgi:hypothetical protein
VHSAGSVGSDRPARVNSGAQEGQVEAEVVADDHGVAEPHGDVGGDLLEERRRRDVPGLDAVDVGAPDVAATTPSGSGECAPGVMRAATMDVMTPH